MIIRTVVFKREENDKWEAGIMIFSKITSDGYILDKEGDRLETVYNYEIMKYHLSVNLEPLFKDLEEHESEKRK